MLELGKNQTLRAIRSTEHGVYLADLTEEELKIADYDETERVLHVRRPAEELAHQGNTFPPGFPAVMRSMSLFTGIPQTA